MEKEYIRKNITVKNLKEKLKQLPENEIVYIEFNQISKKKGTIREIEIPIDTSIIQDKQLKKFVDHLKIHEWIQYEQDEDGITFIDSADMFKGGVDRDVKFFYKIKPSEKTNEKIN